METSYRDLDYDSGKAIQKIRNRIGLTQAGLAEPLGVSVRTVKEWEAGGCYPKAERLQALIALGIQYRAFPKGCEAEEIRALWLTTGQKRLIDEDWLSALLAGPPSPPVQSQETLPPHVAPPQGTPQIPANSRLDVQGQEINPRSLPDTFLTMHVMKNMGHTVINSYFKNEERRAIPWENV